MKKTFIYILALILLILTACSDNEDTNMEETDELKSLEIEFEVPGTAIVGEKILLKATVTYGNESVEDADDVRFEYWEDGMEDDSTTIEAINNGDGIYTAEITFENEGEFSVYAHTTARGSHTMPLKSITVKE